MSNGLVVFLCFALIVLISMLKRATHTINLLSDECVRLSKIIKELKEDSNHERNTK